MSYDLSPYIGTTEDGADSESIRCSVTWTPRGGAPRTIVGDHLNNWYPVPVLLCGIEAILTELDLWDIARPHRDGITDAVNWQLERQPWAEIECPEGKARLVLLPPEQSC